MSNQRCLAAAILAGGRARRFGGTDKAALMIGGTPIIARLVDVLRRVTPHVFAVGDRHGSAARAGVPVVPDASERGGPLTGIYTAIVASPCDRTLVVGCDMPFLTEAFVRHLARFDAADVVMPRRESGYEPLCAIYGRACAAPILERLERGDRHAAVRPEGVHVVEIGPEELSAFDPDGLLFVNVNTPHDYARAQRMLARATTTLKNEPDDDAITDA
ncbi:MAG: molybdenum cofactor guanylyltransferase [Acidobacteria bacterium]|nr:molybdenum cofactor guanylyltransferase [Acidobacteriota bacterium]